MSRPRFAQLWQILGSHEAWPRLKAATIIVVTVQAFFLFAAPPPDDICVRNIYFGRFAHIALNCDSSIAVKAGRDLQTYVEKLDAFRVRPVYILTGTVLVPILSPLALVSRGVIQWLGMSGNFNQHNYLAYFTETFGFNAVNFLVLGITVVMAFELAGGATPLGIALALAISVSDAVHGFSWRQHSDLMNVMVPAGAILFFLFGCRLPVTTPGQAIFVGLATAAGTLTYPYAAVWFPSFGLGWIFSLLRRDSLWPRARELAAALAYAAAATVPVVLLVAFYTIGLHQRFSQEADMFRQFVWIVDAWRDNDLSARMLRNLIDYREELRQVLSVVLPAPLAGLVLILALTHGRVPNAVVARDPVLLGATAAILCMVGFHYLQGFYAPRHEVGFVIPLFVMIARIAWLGMRPRAGVVCLAAIACVEIVQSSLLPPLAG